MIVRRAEELSVEEVVASREMIVAVADGEITAAALLADWLVAGPEARLELGGARTSGPQPADFQSDGHGEDSRRTSGPTTADQRSALLGALVWRIGAKALRLYALGGTGGVADMDSVEWSGRSELALDAAARLIRSRGGDTLERAEFARLFATGKPQEGLAAWLESRSTKRMRT